MHAASRQSGELRRSRLAAGAALRARGPAGPLARSPRIERHQMEQVKLYDTTLRDGMGARACRSRSARSCKVVHALDALGVHFIEAGFPSSNPKEAELFELLAELELEQRDDRAFGMTRRRGRRGRRRRGAARPGRLLRPGRLPGRQELGAAPREGDQGLPRGEPGDDRRLGRLLPRAGQARRSTTPSTSSTATATTPAYALECLRAAADGGRRERHPLRHQRRQPARPRRRRRPRPWSRRSASAVEIGIHTHNDAELRGRQLARRGRSRGAAGAGRRQRLRRALRQRQPGLDPAGAAAEDGLRGASRRRAARRPDRDRATTSTSSAT